MDPGIPLPDEPNPSSGPDATPVPFTFVHVGGSPLWSRDLSMHCWSPPPAYDGPTTPQHQHRDRTQQAGDHPTRARLSGP
jgi:hypothetical protein